MDEQIEVRWEVPPPKPAFGRPARHGSLKTYLKAIMERPGVWARIPTASSSSAVYGAARDMGMKGQFQVSTEPIDGEKSKVDVWARFIGVNGEHRDVPQPDDIPRAQPRKKPDAEADAEAAASESPQEEELPLGVAATIGDDEDDMPF